MPQEPVDDGVRLVPTDADAVPMTAAFRCILREQRVPHIDLRCHRLDERVHEIENALKGELKVGLDIKSEGLRVPFVVQRPESNGEHFVVGSFVDRSASTGIDLAYPSR